MDDFDLGSRNQRYRKKKDEFNNTILELLFNNKTTTCDVVYFFDMHSTKGASFDFKKEANRLVRRLAANHAFDHLSKRDQKMAEIHGKLPEDYVVDFIIPPSVGGSYSFDNLYVAPKEVDQLMYILYWRSLMPEINRFLYKKDRHKIGIKLPNIPRFLSQESFLQMVLPTERSKIEQYLICKKKWRIEALKNVAIKKNNPKYLLICLNRKKHAPAGMVYGFVPVKIVSMLERAQVRQEYLRHRQDIVKKCLLRGDFNGLPESMVATIVSTGHVPESADLTCHHIIPRSLGGKNDIENLCWLSKDVHIDIHHTYINPLIEYLDSLFVENRRIYIEIPLPQNTKIPFYIFTKQKELVSANRRYQAKRKALKKHKVR